MPGTKSGIAHRSWRRVGLAAAAAIVLAFALGEAAVARRKIPAPEPKPRILEPRDIFGLVGTEHPPAKDYAKWTQALARYERERHHERALCLRGECAPMRWRQFLGHLKRSAPMEQLKAVNRYINRVPYRTDLENYGVEDYWATPREFFAKGGDCEDYAIAKYLSLRALGWPAERLRLVVVYDRDRDLVHAALLALHGAAAYVLDIEIAEVTDQRRIRRYVPIFAISEKAWWSFAPVPNLDVAHETNRPKKPEIVRAPEKKEEPPRLGAKPVRAAIDHPAETHDESQAEPMLEPGERIEELFQPGGAQ